MSDQVSPILWIFFQMFVCISVISIVVALNLDVPLLKTLPYHIITAGFLMLWIYQRWYYKNQIMPKRLERLEKRGDE